jgi:hypothetical protein
VETSDGHSAKIKVDGGKDMKGLSERSLDGDQWCVLWFDGLRQKVEWFESKGSAVKYIRRMGIKYPDYGFILAKLLGNYYTVAP